MTATVENIKVKERQKTHYERRVVWVFGSKIKNIYFLNGVKSDVNILDLHIQRKIFIKQVNITNKAK